MACVAPTIVLSCEHGGNDIPPELVACFSGQQRILATHRGYDLGARALAERLALILNVPLYLQTVSRLVIDTNRSLRHPRLFSEWTRDLPLRQRDDIVERYYRPHRQRVESAVAAAIENGSPVFHLAVHSFTPIFDGIRRTADVGLLYDPSRPRENELATRWMSRFAHELPQVRVRRNYPYKGVADALATHLRRLYGPGQYAGMELEVNQAFLLSRRESLGGASSGVLPASSNSSSNSRGSRSSPAKK
jgi:predicted N-formylglutamate amidohydrolase